MDARILLFTLTIFSCNFIPALLVVQPSGGFWESANLQWIEVPVDEPFPENAVYAGEDPANTGAHYVARALYQNELTPGKVLGKYRDMWISYEGLQYKVTWRHEILVTTLKTAWVPASNGTIPPGAIIGGQNAANDAYYYICRAAHGNFIVPGKIRAGSNVCSYPQWTSEYLREEYDVLTVLQ